MSTTSPAPVAARAIDPRLRRPIADAAATQAAPSQQAEAGSAYETAEAAARGTAIHLLLQRLSEGAIAEEALWNELCGRLDLSPAREDYTRWLASARALLAEPALAPYFERSRYARAWNEVAVFTDGITAVIDRLVDDGKSLWVLDYKTHARPDAKVLAERYRAQLVAYVAAVKKIWPDRPVRGGLILTATREFVTVV